MTETGDVVSHFNITKVQVEDGGVYECLVSNRAGQVSHSAKLQVYGSYKRYGINLHTGLIIFTHKTILVRTTMITVSNRNNPNRMTGILDSKEIHDETVRS